MSIIKNNEQIVLLHYEFTKILYLMKTGILSFENKPQFY
jgi:hypothetical protein